MKKDAVLLFSLFAVMLCQAKVIRLPLGLGDNHDAKIYGDTLFVSCKKGIYACSLADNYPQWVAYAFNGMEITSFVKSGQKLLAVYRYFINNPETNTSREQQALLASDDWGETYRDVTPADVTGFGTEIGCIIRVLQLPDSPNHLLLAYPSRDYSFVFGTEGKLKESTDFGSQWTLKEPVFPPTGELAVATDDPNRFMVYGLKPNVDCICPYLLETKDYFQTLTNVAFEVQGLINDPAFQSIAYNPTDSRQLLAATSSGIAKSTDGGVTWQIVVERDALFYGYRGFSKVLFDSEDARTVYAVNNSYDAGQMNMELYRSLDGGDSWSKVYTAKDNQTTVKDMLMYNGQFVCIGWNNNVFIIDSEGIPASIAVPEQQAVQPGTVYDLSGRQLKGKPSQPGVYIQNGRKVVVK